MTSQSYPYPFFLLNYLAGQITNSDQHIEIAA